MAEGIIEEAGTPEKIFDNPQSEKTRSFLRGTQERF
jgi:ABC-type histidine transport system ATPase subunit